MGNGSGVSRGDRNRNARLARLRVLVPSTNAIVGIDLADKKQMVVVTDHDSKVLAVRLSGVMRGIWAGRWTGLVSRPPGRVSPESRWRASRPLTVGGGWGSWPPGRGCRSGVQPV